MTDTPTISAIIADMLAYEARKFDAGPVFDVVKINADGSEQVVFYSCETRDEAENIAIGANDTAGKTRYEVREIPGEDRDLSVCGADLVDAFAEWRQQIKAALPGHLAMIEAGDTLASLMEDAESTHIYDFDNGDEQEDDCAYKAAREAWGAAKASVQVASEAADAVTADETIRELRAAMSGLEEQIDQMKGMFDDEDGAIERALDDAAYADEVAKAFAEGKPKPPIPDDEEREHTPECPAQYGFSCRCGAGDDTDAGLIEGDA
jgi:hypothetical protein